MDKGTLQSYAPIVVRLALVLVFILIGIDQMIHPLEWKGFFPDFLPDNAVQMNAFFDLLLGVWIASGFFIRFSAGLAVLHLLGVVGAILLTSGYNQILIRDLGILGMAVAVLIYGKDMWCFGKS